MKKLEECKEMYKELYMNCLDYEAFDKNRFTSTELAVYETFCETLLFIYGTDFDRIQNTWSQEALMEYYRMKSQR